MYSKDALSVIPLWTLQRRRSNDSEMKMTRHRNALLVIFFPLDSLAFGQSGVWTVWRVSPSHGKHDQGDHTLQRRATYDGLRDGTSPVDTYSI